jgi:hypothetical protein
VLSSQEITMKKILPGYFTPTDEEFGALWKDSLFGFDANVLLGLYRSTAETQQVFFDVLARIEDRIFLPHQAAFEYLRNRLGVISLRADSYERIKGESEKFTKFLEATIRDHSLPMGEAIIEASRKATLEISQLVGAAETVEPDLLRSDELLARLEDVFGSSTGSPFDPARLKEIYAVGAQRYSQAIPPGYKDDKKGEPDKYGDLLVWFQLLERAKTAKKSIIFVTGDQKEDWWLQHKGATIGPRPELRQEMKAVAGVDFYMYTTPRFLEFAKQFLVLNFDTKKAETEFEEIEKQDKQANFGNYVQFTGGTQRWEPPYFVTNKSISNASLVNYANSVMHETNFSVPRFTYTADDTQWTDVDDPVWGFVPTYPPVEPEPKNRYFQLLPIHKRVFITSTGRWMCEIARNPNTNGLDQVCYRLAFRSEERPEESKSLELWGSIEKLNNDHDGRYKAAILGAISKWLSSDLTVGQMTFMS